jgi:hypothetical protein
MANVKISGLPPAAALAGGELVPVVQAGTTKRTTAQDVANLAPAVAFPVTIPQGGTGQTTQQAALDALFGFVAKGSLAVGNGTHIVPFAVGADGLVLTADHTAPDGVKWAAAGGGAPAGPLYAVQINDPLGTFAGPTNLLCNPGAYFVVQNPGPPTVYNELSVSWIDGFVRVGTQAGPDLYSLDTINTKISWFGGVAVGQQLANQGMADTTGGFASLTLVDVTTGGLADPVKCNDNFASLYARLFEIRQLLTNYGLGT